MSNKRSETSEKGEKEQSVKTAAETPSKVQKGELSKKGESFEEIEDMFESIEKEFDNTFRQTFGSFGKPFRPKRFASPSEELQTIYDQIQQDIENTFKRSMGMLNDFKGRTMIEQEKQAQQSSKSEGAQVEQGKKENVQIEDETPKASN